MFRPQSVFENETHGKFSVRIQYMSYVDDVHTFHTQFCLRLSPPGSMSVEKIIICYFSLTNT